MEGNISANDVEHLARLSFEESAKAFMKETINSERKADQGACGDAVYILAVTITDQNYTGSPPKEGSFEEQWTFLALG